MNNFCAATEPPGRFGSPKRTECDSSHLLAHERPWSNIGVSAACLALCDPCLTSSDVAASGTKDLLSKFLPVREWRRASRGEHPVAAVARPPSIERVGVLRPTGTV